jgi:hypothetical protein
MRKGVFLLPIGVSAGDSVDVVADRPHGEDAIHQGKRKLVRIDLRKWRAHNVKGLHATSKKASAAAIRVLVTGSVDAAT